MDFSIIDFLEVDVYYLFLKRFLLLFIIGKQGKNMEDIVELRQGQALFIEGQDGNEMYVINSGHIILTKKTDDGDIEIARLGKGEFLGEMALLQNRVRSCSARAGSQTSLRAYSAEKFKTLINNNSGVALRVIEGLAQRLEKTTAKLNCQLAVLE